MADFALAIKTVLQHEGKYVDNPADPGGATNYGISLRWLTSIGDADNDGVLDGDIDLDGDVDADDIAKMTVEQAEGFYKLHWWDKYGYGKIQDQSVAVKVFDLAVNMGAKQAHKCLQRAIRSAKLLKLKDDGILGQQTLDAANSTNYTHLLCALRSEAAGFYRSLNRPQFLEGWLNRAYS
jgi:lysozyme family protein